jgi:hypothetical protein
MKKASVFGLGTLVAAATASCAGDSTSYNFGPLLRELSSQNLYKAGN